MNSILSVIKNPILIGVCAGGLMYGYLQYNKKKDETVSLIKPLILALIVTIIAYYVQYNNGCAVDLGVEEHV